MGTIEPVTNNLDVSPEASGDALRFLARVLADAGLAAAQAGDVLLAHECSLGVRMLMEMLEVNVGANPLTIQSEGGDQQP